MHYKKRFLILAGSIALSSAQMCLAANLPFPQSKVQQGIKPNSHPQSALNQTVASYYDYWKSEYLRQAATGGYYVHGADTDGHGKGTSESHGYGMLITALMAGHDANAKIAFDGLFEFFDNHRSTINSELMGWKIDSNEASSTYSSAADGDMDIAYALLLADKQWGSSGNIDYRQEAIDMITQGLKVSIYNASSDRIMLGDWDSKALTTRSSDWMPAHIRAYQAATGDQDWQKAIDEIYLMVDQINQQNDGTGLMPDFVTGSIATPDHNNDNGTGEKKSGDYFYNAARTPLRIAIDYIHHGSSQSKQASQKLTQWVKTQIGSNYDFSAYQAGYTVKGIPLDGANYTDTTFVAPIVVAASVDSANQAMVNAGWSFIKGRKVDYFSDTINLMSMLTLTGNWWSPDNVQTTPVTSPVATDKQAVTDKNTPVNIKLEGNDDGWITDYQIAEQPNHGNVSLSADNAQYQPNQDFVGLDGFTYIVIDNDGNSSQPASVTINVNDTDAPPPPQGLTCVVEEVVWDTGFSTSITVANNTSEVIEGWQVELVLGTHDTFDKGWSAEFGLFGNTITASGLDWNFQLAPNTSTQFGFNGKTTGNHQKTRCQ